MGTAADGVRLIVAEDDEDQFLLVKNAFASAGVRNELVWVKDGKELLDLLRRERAVAAADDGRLLVLLDLNMPRMDGREALVQIKADPALRGIPIVVMTTSNVEEDVARCYSQGANSFIRKPVAFEDFVKAAVVLKRYWLDLVEWPAPGGVSWIKE